MAPELHNVIANLELMPQRMNASKRDRVGERQLSHARSLRRAGLLSTEGLRAVEASARPTSGAPVLDDFWRDALGGEWRSTGAGTPGTWLQIRPAAVTADPSSGTIPVGYWVWNIISGHIKRHADGYVCIPAERVAELD